MTIDPGTAARVGALDSDKLAAVQLAEHDITVVGSKIYWQGQLLVALRGDPEGLAYRNQYGETSTFDSAEEAARFIAVELNIVSAASVRPG